MKRVILQVVMLWGILCSTNALGQSSNGFVQSVPAHPRLLMTTADQKAIGEHIRSNETWKRLHADILSECNRMVALPTLERKQIGMRLLATSREALRRIFFLSYAYRMTGEPAYLNRAEQELLAVCRFDDWNPSHFLDVAEMLVGVSIGYDWLYNDLSESSKLLIRNAIVQKGLFPSTESKYNWWLEAKHNWNQVCNAGIAFGALAVYEENPFQFQYFIDRSIVSMRLPMKDYDPDGAYAEGYSYWEYGTTFNVLFLSAAEKVFGSDFGLSALPGFSQTARYFLHMVGPTGKSFNYADCGQEYGLAPAMFWFAGQAGDPSLLWLEKDFLKASYQENYLANRLLPAVMVWGSHWVIDSIQPPSSLMWHGRGTTPVAVMRTSWEQPQALYVGLKGGTASSNHAHMDAGSFVMEADGVRWAMDFGREDYERLESNGLQIWTNTQHSERWKVFRYNNFAHNTLSVNDSLHQAAGYASLVSCRADEDFMAAVTDLSPVFSGELQYAKRGAAIVHKSYAVVRDEVESLPDKSAKIRWNMVTPAKVAFTRGNRIELRAEGKKLDMIVDSPYPVEWKTWSTQSPHSFDSPNAGTTMVGFEVVLPPGRKATLTVALLPSGVKYNSKDIPPLAQWEQPRNTK